MLARAQGTVLYNTHGAVVGSAHARPPRFFADMLIAAPGEENSRAAVSRDARLVALFAGDFALAGDLAGDLAGAFAGEGFGLAAGLAGEVFSTSLAGDLAARFGRLLAMGAGAACRGRTRTTIQKSEMEAHVCVWWTARRALKRTASVAGAASAGFLSFMKIMTLTRAITVTTAAMRGRVGLVMSMVVPGGAMAECWTDG